jgi:hypothetical protein
MFSKSRVLLVLLAAACGLAQAPAVSQIADRLTANGLMADVSFLASDALEGRGTPSRGLDLAAEYIAAQFRRAGLEPAGDDGYFQTAPFEQVTPDPSAFDLELEIEGRTIHAQNSAASLEEPAALDLSHAEVIKVESGPAALSGLTPQIVRGKVIVAGPASGGWTFPALPPEFQPALLILLRSGGRGGNPEPRLRDGSTRAVPTLAVWDPQFRSRLGAAKPGPMGARISAHIAAPVTTPVKLRNVAGVLRGSDPVLKDTVLLVTAHYDHLGTRGAGPGDRIFNGADDDASGTASVIGIADTLASLARRPRRSIVFLTFFGEELGEVGSRYYVRHPIFPLARTAADINLEQLGRTDGSEGAHVGMFNLTGFDFTDMPGAFRKAGVEAGIRLVKDANKSDRYFPASDNFPFASSGIPSTTVSVTYEFPDYHLPGDEWRKLDYQNMAKVDRAVALAVYAIADSVAEPQWNTANPQAQRFVKARQNH